MSTATVSGQGASPAANLAAPAGVRWLASEEVLLITTQLPAMPAAQRRSAVAFAVEDRIAEPLEQVHVALGPMVGDAFLVAVVRRSVLEGAMAGLQAKARLLPDVLALPIPAAGWAVWQGGGRVLLRCSDGTGLACRAADLGLLWEAAQRPAIALYAGSLPEGVTVTSRAALPALDPGLQRFDLAEGAGASGLLRLPRGSVAIAAGLALAALVHVGLLATDVQTFQKVAAARGAAVREGLTRLGQADTGDLDGDLAKALAAAEPPAVGGFLPLMAQSSQALAAAGGIRLDGLTWADPTLTLQIEAPDLAGLQAAEAALSGAGITVAMGPATSADGAAKAELTLQGGI